MIFVQEIEPIKLSGKSSFLIKFPYNKELIVCVKAAGAAYYHNKHSAWELTATGIGKFLDMATFYDSITLTLLSDINDTNLEEAKNGIVWIPDFLGPVK